MRYQARLDAEMQAKLNDLATTLHRKRAPILRYVMQWGLVHGHAWTIDPSIPAVVHLVHVLVDPALMQQVQEAASRDSAHVASWIRYTLRQVTLEDFPASWRTGETAPRSHDSRYYHRPFMLRLDHRGHPIVPKWATSLEGSS